MSNTDTPSTPQLYDAACRALLSATGSVADDIERAHSSGAALELANTAKALAEAFAAIRSTSPPAL